jgi:DNA-directed RNA polymerase specialized sigma24 family protein
MAEVTAADYHAFSGNVETQARTVASRYGFDWEDVAQEIWLYLCSGTVIESLRKFAQDDESSGRVNRVLYTAAVRYCEDERKRTLGYDWRDEYNYSRPEVARLLPLALDPSTIPGLAGGGLHDGPSAKSDPAYGGGMLASIVDVRVALGRLSESDREYVKLVVALDSKWETVALHTGVKANSAQAKFYRILDRMVTRHLGRKVDDGAA